MREEAVDFNGSKTHAGQNCAIEFNNIGQMKFS